MEMDKTFCNLGCTVEEWSLHDEMPTFFLFFSFSGHSGSSRCPKTWMDGILRKGLTIKCVNFHCCTNSTLQFSLLAVIYIFTVFLASNTVTLK